MKKMILLLIVITTLGSVQLHAQHVRVRLNFPVGISIGASGHAPYRDAIWIGPEWTWRGGGYVAVPGYWARPPRHGARWIGGHWKYRHHDYIWIPGHWN